MVTAGLEGLVAEIRIKILFEIREFQSLRSLVRASPAFHASYRVAGREKVLTHLALRDLDHPLRADALAAVRSARYYEGPRRAVHRMHIEAERTTQFLEEYARIRADPDPEWLSCRSITEALDLIHLREAVNLVFNDYYRSVASKMPQPQSRLSPSDLETVRIYRAMYRFQIYCDFLGHNPVLVIPGMYQPGRHPAHHIFDPFSPWEVMEMACIWKYLNGRWWTVLREASDTGRLKKYDRTVYEDMEEKEALETLILDPWDDLDSGPFGSEKDEDDEAYQKYCTRERYLHCVYLGPRFLAKYLSTETSQELCEAVAEVFPHRRLTDFERCVRMYYTIHHGLAYPANKYLESDILARLPKLPKLEQPSDGWKWFCRRYDIGSFGLGAHASDEWWQINEHISGHELRWGYVFWDREKLETWEVTTPSFFDDETADGGDVEDVEQGGEMLLD